MESDIALHARVTDVVRTHWGFDTLRPLQLDAIRAGLEQRDSLVVLPTGGGKSLCYQVPPLVADRLDVVVSPLISLMRDQVDALTQNGYPAAAVHSNLSPRERQDIRDGLRQNKFKLLFIAPERIINSEYLNFFERINVRCFAIDEAHCISQWGHDFRPEYRQLALLKERFPQASVHAYTATATERVRKDIIDKLSLVNPNVLVGTFDRPNLVYRILPTVDVYAQTLEAVRRHAREAVIVYCLSRKDTEGMAAFLKANGTSAAHYHAGMESRDRSKVQDAFAREELDVVCATVAFGMGIDRSNVRCVIHASMPKSIEHYQQETGRAGRDGLEAECVLFYSAGDVMRWDSLIQKSAQNAEDPATVIASGRELLNHIAGFCRSSNCRHGLLSEYFDQAYEKNNCQACDVCLNEVGVMSDSTTIAQKILSCVYRIGQCFGIRYIVEVLRGAKTEKVRERGHESLSTYGILRELPDKALTQLVYQLVDQGLLEREPGDRPVVKLGAEAMDVLRGEKEVRLVEPAVTTSKTAASEES